MTLALAMSRRDPRAQVWFIQRTIQAANYDAAVRHFDIAMRTSSRRSANLTPLLVTASVDPRLVPPLSAALSRQPTWRIDFLRMLVAAGRDLDTVTRLSLPHLDPGRPDEREILARLINRMVRESRPDLGWLAYRRARPGTADSSAASLRGGDFTTIGDLPPFDWQLTDDPELTAARVVREDRQGDYALALMAGAGRTGIVARQLLRLPPGRFTLRFEMGRVAATEADRPQVRMNCASGNEIAAFRPGSGWSAANRLAMPFTVPAGCRWQWLSISVASGSTQTQYPWIDNVAVSAPET